MTRKVQIDVSVIVLNWNTRDLLGQCLKSVCMQTKSNAYEIIVVDNGSSDGSAEFVEKEFPHVRLIRNKENLGFAKANNIGIRASTGRYMCLINSDVTVQNNSIEKLMEFMDASPSVGMSGPRILNPDGSLQVSCRHFPSVWKSLCQTLGFNKLFPKSAFLSEPFMKYWAHNEIRNVDVLGGCFWMVRREALNQAGLLDEHFFFYGEDIDWCRRFHMAGWDVVFYPYAEAIHVLSASSSKDPIRFHIELHKSDMRYWRKYHGRMGRVSYWMLILFRNLVRLPVYALIYIFLPRARNNYVLKIKRALRCTCWLFTGQKNRG